MGEGLGGGDPVELLPDHRCTQAVQTLARSRTADVSSDRTTQRVPLRFPSSQRLPEPLLGFAYFSAAWGGPRREPWFFISFRSVRWRHPPPPAPPQRGGGRVRPSAQLLPRAARAPQVPVTARRPQGRVPNRQYPNRSSLLSN